MNRRKFHYRYLVLEGIWKNDLQFSSSTNMNFMFSAHHLQGFDQFYERFTGLENPVFVCKRACWGHRVFKLSMYVCTCLCIYLFIDLSI